MEKNTQKILVHTCCASCLSYVTKILDTKNLEPTVYFFNPNVHGRAEYNDRLEGVKHFCQEKKIKIIVPEYDIQEFFLPIMPFQDKNSIKYINDKKRWRVKRCQSCFSTQLTATAKEAKKKKFPLFTTTLLTTPYKDHDEIWNIGLELERETNVTFFYTDFRKGYWSGRNYSRSHGLKIPTYCGCVYSAEEGILE